MKGRITYKLPPVSGELPQWHSLWCSNPWAYGEKWKSVNYLYARSGWRSRAGGHTSVE